MSRRLDTTPDFKAGESSTGTKRDKDLRIKSGDLTRPLLDTGQQDNKPESADIQAPSGSLRHGSEVHHSLHNERTVAPNPTDLDTARRNVTELFKVSLSYLLARIEKGNACFSSFLILPK